VHLEPATPAAVRVLAISDTDSYLKWSAATLEALPDSWESTQLLIENPVMPSLAQTRAASKRPVEVLTHAPLVISYPRTRLSEPLPPSGCPRAEGQLQRLS